MRSAWRLFLDQNIRYEIKEMLQSHGVDVLHASDVSLQRALDPDVLQFAIGHDRILVTHDSEFGDLHIFPLPPHHNGVIRLKVIPPTPRVVMDALVPFLDSHRFEDVRNALVIITKDKVRFRRTN